MFSQRITNSARFQQMAPSAQALYFHLGMAADDDGVVEAFMVMRTTKAAEDDFRVLVAKKFVVPLNEEQVSYILDWNEHNLIRPDRLTPSIHRELLVKVIPDVELANPRRRADLPALPTGRPVDNQRTAQDRIGKDRLELAVADAPAGYEIVSLKEYDTERAPKKPAKYPNARTAFSWFPFQEKSWLTNTTELKHGEMLFERGEQQVRAAMKFYMANRDDEFCPQITKPSDLERKWRDLLAYAKKHD